MASFVLSVPLIVAISIVTSSLAFAALMLLTGAGIQLTIGVYYVYVSELAEPGTRGTCLAMVTPASTLGALVAPAVGGWLIHRKRLVDCRVHIRGSRRSRARDPNS